MPKYIDAEALKAVMVFSQKTGDWTVREMRNILSLIDSMPAADVVPVVRCKDCRHTKTDGIDAIYCQKWDRWEMPPNAYCYLGEKRKAEPPKEEDDDNH